MTNFNDITIPDWAKTEKNEGIIYEGFPLSYRFDGGDGNFYLGSESLGQDLGIHAFDYAWEYAQRWGFPPQSWLDIAFVNANGVASVCSFKKDSAVNLLVFLTELKSRGLALDAIWLGLRAKPMKSQVDGAESTYFVVEVEFWRLVAQDHWASVRAFKDSEIFKFELIGEV